MAIGEAEPGRGPAPRLRPSATSESTPDPGHMHTNTQAGRAGLGRGSLGRGRLPALSAVLMFENRHASVGSLRAGCAE